MIKINPYLRTLAAIILCAGITACSSGKKDQSSETKMKTQTETKSQISQADTTTQQKLNINSASEAQFRTIPQVGDKMVHEFKEYRPYTSIRQFRQEIGKYVDEDQVAIYEQYIYVPIRPDQSDIETLMQIPGLTKEQAQNVVDQRPYSNKQGFFEVIGKELTGLQLEMAKTYTVVK